MTAYTFKGVILVVPAVNRYGCGNGATVIQDGRVVRQSLCPCEDDPSFCALDVPVCACGKPRELWHGRWYCNNPSCSECATVEEMWNEEMRRRRV